jgi:hypothetical protein
VRRTISERTIALTLIAILNSAWLFSLGCGALCAFASCPQKSQPQAEDSCHHRGVMPASQRATQSHSRCPHDGYPVIALTTGSPAPRLAQSSTLAVSTFDSLALVAPHRVVQQDLFSHSPPGFLTQRIVHQKEYLLRI